MMLSRLTINYVSILRGVVEGFITVADVFLNRIFNDGVQISW